MITAIQYDNAPNKLESVWQLYSYEVWGNKKDGFEINNTFKGVQCTIELSKTVHNEGTPYRFILNTSITLTHGRNDSTINIEDEFTSYFNNSKVFILDTDRFIEGVFIDFKHKILNRLSDEWDHINSDEYIKDKLIALDHNYLINGTQFND